MKEAFEIMTRNPIVVPASTSFMDCLNLFIENGITTAPVTDAFNELKGLITELALIKLYFRVHSANEVKEQLAFHFDLLEPVETVQETDSVNDTIRALLKSPANRVVVLDRQKRIVGIVSPKDLMKVLSGDRSRQNKMQRELEQTQEALKRTLSKLHDSEDLFSRYQNYLESAPFLMHSVDENGKIIMANKRLNEFLGYEPGELVGKDQDTLFDSESAKKFSDGLKALKKNEQSPSLVAIMKRKNGDETRVEAISTALRNANGKFVGAITMSRRLAADNMLRALNGVLDKDTKPFD